MHRILYIFITFIIFQPAHATFQIPETIKYENTIYESLEEPLDTYIQKNKINILKITNSLCSANWRGYLGGWAILENYLYLEKLYIDPCSTKKEIPITEIFPHEKGIVKAIWFTGEIRLFNKAHYGEAPAFILKIINGKVSN